MDAISYNKKHVCIGITVDQSIFPLHVVFVLMQVLLNGKAINSAFSVSLSEIANSCYIGTFYWAVFFRLHVPALSCSVLKWSLYILSVVWFKHFLFITVMFLLGYISESTVKNKIVWKQNKILVENFVLNIFFTSISALNSFYYCSCILRIRELFHKVRFRSHIISLSSMKYFISSVLPLFNMTCFLHILSFWSSDVE